MGVTNICTRSRNAHDLSATAAERYNPSMLTESPHTPHRADPSRWVLALTILLGQITMALSIFAVAWLGTSNP
jgi:hypothetical protein